MCIVREDVKKGVKGNKILLSLAQTPIQTILFLDFFLADIFLFDANKGICFCLEESPTFT